MVKIIHYPWRAYLPQTSWKELPLPAEGHAAPGLGSYIVTKAGLEEIPGPTMRKGVGQIWCRTAGGDVYFDDVAVNHFQRLSPSDFPRRLHYALTDAFIYLTALLYEGARREQGAFADIPLADACRSFSSYLIAEHDFATESLVVDIARNCCAVLDGIVVSPRKSLSRRHDEVSLDHLQELDEYALRSLAYRPGRTIAMKAGGKQRLTGVVRAEFSDTFENRVVRDFLSRASVKAEQYVTEMCGRCPSASACADSRQSAYAVNCKSPRVCLVSAFHRKCLVWLRAFAQLGVQPLAQPTVRPNYVLQQNPRYAIVWRYYQRLLKEENVEDDVWRWMRRTWADYLRMVMMTVWELRLRKQSKVLLSRRPFQIRQSNDRGAWLCDDPYEEALVWEDAFTGEMTTIYLLNATEAMDLLRCETLEKLNPDFLWVAIRPSGDRRILPVWALSSCPLLAREGADSALAAELDRVAECFNGSNAAHTANVAMVAPLVILPDIKNEVVRGAAGRVWKCVSFRPNLGILRSLIMELMT